ncbi:MAG: asparagine synthase B [Sphaerochaetaceae bacterium]|nr:asparagine synthase B [Sphaerochaetaceae bacterium]
MCSIIGYTSSHYSSDYVGKFFDRTVSRGPDCSSFKYVGNNTYLGFHRLAIMDCENTGMQPFFLDNNAVVCNGEIYGFRPIKEQLKKKYSFKSNSDCEVLLPLYKEKGVQMFKDLDAEFALIIYDSETSSLIAARDPIGIRPLFYGYLSDGNIIFCSEARCLVGLCDKVTSFPPGHYYKDGQFVRFADVSKPDTIVHEDIDTVCRKIRDLLIDGVEKRLDSDAPLGFLLSGGLDSSLVCAISSKILGRKIRTFAIGMDTDPIDLKYAAEVASFINSDHMEVRMTEEEVLSNLETVISILGTWDITTIRASMGMYLCCKAIHEKTDIKVLLTGEISDELFGYKYTDFAPSAKAFQEESEKRIRELHYYDVLRADRCISDNSLEARVPFGDLSFVKYVMSIDPSLKMNTYNMGKYLLRKAFEKDNILPSSILWRQKAAFSDAVGHSMVDGLKQYAEKKYSDEEYEIKRNRYEHCCPFTKESLLYREIFEKYYPGQDRLIPDYWMPNKDWEGCNVSDPSARVLSNYGDSGK